MNTTETMYSTKDKNWVIRLIKKNAAHFEKAIKNAKMEYYPYEHIFVENVFREEFCDWVDWLYTQIPKDRFQEMADSRYVSRGYSVGRKCFFVRGHREGGDGLVNRIEDPQLKMHFRGFRSFFLDLSKKPLEDIFRIKPNSPGHEVLMIEDRSGYDIRPHVDVDSKIITALFYMPLVPEIEDAGTAILETRRWRDTTVGYSEKSFHSIKRVPFKRNSMVAFKVSDLSWHSVPKYNGSEPRRLIMTSLRNESSERKKPVT